MTATKKRKVTIYLVGAFGISKLETNLVGITRGKYAQYPDALFITHRRPRKRSDSRIVFHADGGERTPFVLIVEGWGHPDPLDWLSAPEVSSPGVSTRKSRFASFDPHYRVEAEEFRTKLLATGVEVIHDELAEKKEVPARVSTEPVVKSLYGTENLFA